MSLRIEKLSDNVLSNIITIKSKLQLSTIRIAEATNKASAVVGRYFRGEKNPPEDWINTFCFVYCIDKDWLINGTGEPVFTGEPSPAVVLKSSQNAGDRVKAVRKDAGLTQTEFGERIGISHIGVYNIEKNTTNLTPFSASRIEEQFDIGKDWLMFGDEGKKNYPLSEKLTDWLWKNESIRKELWERMERDNKNEEEKSRT